jgi:hypothetical protein
VAVGRRRCARKSKEEQQAEKLAADINAIAAEKATVSGETASLTGDVRLETALTVPAGVTLDLAQETLELADNAVLTVNGTVNAKAEGIHVLHHARRCDFG